MLDRLLGNFLVENGRITKQQLAGAFSSQEANRAKLGVIAVSEKLMTIAQAEQINNLQSSMDKRFGDIALEKGYLTQPQLSRLLELQGNSYLAFVQALVDTGLLTMEQVSDAENEYQSAYGLTATDMVDLKSDDIDRIVPIFMDTNDDRLRRMFAMAIRNMYRLVDNHLHIGKVYRTQSVRDEVMGCQKYHGAESASIIISGKYDDVRKMAIAYTKDEFIETEEDALDAICELINCMNGLYASEMSKNGVLIELTPPDFYVTYSEAREEDYIVMPIYLSGGVIKYFVALSDKAVIGR